MLAQRIGRFATTSMEDTTTKDRPQSMGFFRNAASVLLTSVGSIPVALAASIVLARYLSVPDRGTFGVARQITFITVMFLNLAWPTAAIYRLRRAVAPPGQVAASGLLLVVLISIAATAVFLLLEPLLLERFLPGTSPAVLRLALALVPFHAMGMILSGIAAGLDRFSLRNAYTFGVNSGILVALIFALVIREGSVVDALVAVLCVQALLTLWLAVAVLAHTGIQLRSCFGEFFLTLRYGAKNWVHTLAGNLHERIDVFMIIYLLRDPAQVAFYAIAVGLLDRLKLVPEAFATAAFPQLAGSDQQQAADQISKILRHAVFLVFLLTIILGLAGPFLIPLFYGTPYRASIVPFLIMLPGVGLLTLYRLLSRYFAAVNQQSTTIVIQFTSVGLNVGLNAWLIPRYGIVGAAAASLFSYTVETAVLATIFLLRTSKKLREMILIRAGDFDEYRGRLSAVLRRLPGTMPID